MGNGQFGVLGVAPIFVTGIFYLLYKWGVFHEGKKDLEPSLNILTDEEILKFAPKSKAAHKIKAKQSGNVYKS
ncbi:MAG: hypothetical protein FWH54_01495 [Methanobrevibacter sp.]|nr:hypothetical protein [Methanobrevibacter sp.]